MAGNPITGELANGSIATANPGMDSYSAEVIEKWLVDKLSELLGVAPEEIDVREPFASYGMGSTEAVSLSGELGDWLAAARQPRVPMTRFRPSVVVAGAPPWAEDRWRRIRIGTVPFRVAKPCGRCVVTTTDQVTGERGRQPLKLLGRRRRFGKELVFGQNLIPDSGGMLRVGDPVEILDAA